MALMKNRTDAASMQRTRPNLSDRRPAKYAPTAAPINASDTASPSCISLQPKYPFSATLAPLMTDESKPNRNPPMAAERVIMMTCPTL